MCSAPPAPRGGAGWHEPPGVFALPAGFWLPTCREMAQGWWANVADGRICGRNRGGSGSTCGNPGAEAPTPEPAPAAAQRLPRFLWQPAALQHLWLIPPTLGRRLAMPGRAPGWPQAEKTFKRALYSRMGREYNRPDEGKWFICGAGVPGYHPKTGGYPDLFNHLLAVS